MGEGVRTFIGRETARMAACGNAVDGEAEQPLLVTSVQACEEGGLSFHTKST